MRAGVLAGSVSTAREPRRPRDDPSQGTAVNGLNQATLAATQTVNAALQIAAGLQESFNDKLGAAHERAPEPRTSRPSSRRRSKRSTP